MMEQRQSVQTGLRSRDFIQGGSVWTVWLLIFLVAVPAASGSHFRFGNLAWRRAAGATNSLTVEITVVEAWRANSSGTGEIDYSFGDGSGTFDTSDAVLVSELTDVAGEGYKIWTHTVTHTYPSNGVYTVSGDSCCRISSLINAGSDSETLTAVVDLQASNTGSPVTSSSVILQMQTGRSNAVALPIADPDGDAFSVRMATAAESEIGSVATIGNETLSVSSQGVLQWDTTSGNNGAKYAVQVIVEENHGSGGTGRVPLDFIIELVGTVNNSAPTCTGPVGTIRTAAGANVALSIQAVDPESRPLRLAHQGLPPGASLTPAAGTTNASGATVTFNWTPTASQAGQSFPVIVLFTDDGGLQTQCAFALTVATGPPDFDLVSVKTGGSGSGNAGSANPALSADGNLVVFASDAGDLVAGDANGKTDIFLRNRTGRTTERISVNASGASANGDSRNPVISADGRYVAFQSSAADLVGGDNNGRIDVFVRDRTLGQTVLVSVDNGGNNSGAGNSYSPQFTADGRKVAFASTADNLVTNDSNGTADAFVRDLTAGTTLLASVNTNGFSGNAISAPPMITPDGRYVAFLSAAGDLVGNDTNGLNDAYRRDLMSGITELVSVSTSGQAGNRLSFHPVISGNGMRVAFATQATDLTATPDDNNVTDVYLRDFGSNATVLVSKVPGGSAAGQSASGTPVFSADGTHLLFISIATDLTGNDTNGKQDVFLWSAATDANELISVNLAGNAPGNGFSGITAASMSGDLSQIVFFSEASDVASGDTNGAADIFLRNRTENITTLISRPADSPLAGNGANFSPFISSNGATVVFSSDATNLAANDTNGATDIFGISTTNKLAGFGFTDLRLTVVGTLSRRSAAITSRPC
jgi:Tol biopolymer transport system component